MRLLNGTWAFAMMLILIEKYLSVPTQKFPDVMGDVGTVIFLQIMWGWTTHSKIPMVIRVIGFLPVFASCMNMHCWISHMLSVPLALHKTIVLLLVQFGYIVDAGFCIYQVYVSIPVSLYRKVKVISQTEATNNTVLVVEEKQKSETA